MKLMTPCFSNVGSTGKVTLKDITVSGYRDANGDYLECCEDGVENAVVIAKINNNGATLRQKVNDVEYNVQYFWFDTEDKPAGWYDQKGKPMTKDGGSLWGDAADIEFTNGNGFRIMVSDEYEDEDDPSGYVPFVVNFSGEVLKGDISISTYTPGAMKAAGNPTPVEINLSQMTVSGYTDKDGNYLEWCEDGVENACVIAKVNNNGATLRQKVNEVEYNVQYFWYDTEDKAAGWYDQKGKPMTKDGGSLWGDAADIKYKACDGFRVMMSDEYEDDDGPLQFSLNIPSCID